MLALEGEGGDTRLARTGMGYDSIAVENGHSPGAQLAMLFPSFTKALSQMTALPLNPYSLQTLPLVHRTNSSPHEPTSQAPLFRQERRLKIAVQRLKLIYNVLHPFLRPRVNYAGPRR